MDWLAQLEDQSDQLAAAVKSLAASYRCSLPSRDPPWVDPDSDKELEQAKASILASVTRIRTLVCGPAHFLQHLASKVEVLAGLQWLGELQIMPCIPLNMSVPIKDVADLAGVPELQLTRIIRLTATCGFLEEPQSGVVAHTPLSAEFIANPSLLDAVMFTAESAIPAALHIPPTAQGLPPTAAQPLGQTGYNLGLHTAAPFHVALQENPKVRRRWSAYLQHAAGLHGPEAVAEVITQLNWSNLANACIVEQVGAHSTSIARALVKLYPTLRLIVQISETDGETSNPARAGELQREIQETASLASSNGRITVTYPTAGVPQPVTNAAVYIIHLPTSSPKLPDAIAAQLQGYLGVLRANGGVMLLLTARLLPEPGSLPDPAVEAVARARDLSMLKLAKQGEMELLELLEVIDAARDGLGRLVVINKLLSREGLVVAVAAKYQAH